MRPEHSEILALIWGTAYFGSDFFELSSIVSVARGKKGQGKEEK